MFTLPPIGSGLPVETEQKLESVRSTHYETELLRKLYLNLPDCDVWATLEEMVQGLGFEYMGAEVEEALSLLEEQGVAQHLYVLACVVVIV